MSSSPWSASPARAALIPGGALIRTTAAGSLVASGALAGLVAWAGLGALAPGLIAGAALVAAARAGAASGRRRETFEVVGEGLYWGSARLGDVWSLDGVRYARDLRGGVCLAFRPGGNVIVRFERTRDAVAWLSALGAGDHPARPFALPSSPADRVGSVLSVALDRFEPDRLFVFDDALALDGSGARGGLTTCPYDDVVAIALEGRAVVVERRGNSALRLPLSFWGEDPAETGLGYEVFRALDRALAAFRESSAPEPPAALLAALAGPGPAIERLRALRALGDRRGYRRAEVDHEALLALASCPKTRPSLRAAAALACRHPGIRAARRELPGRTGCRPLASLLRRDPELADETLVADLFDAVLAAEEREGPARSLTSR